MSTTTTKSTDTKTSYRVTFERIGRRHDIFPLVAHVRNAEHLAKVVYTYARPHLGSRDVRIDVDLYTLKGTIFCGFQVGGTFTIEHVSSVALLRAAAAAAPHGPIRDYYERAASDHEGYGDVCPAGGNCWFEREARADLAKAGTTVAS